jgi:hypothetical protein
LPAIRPSLHIKAAAVPSSGDAVAHASPAVASVTQHGGVSLLVQVPLLVAGLLLMLWSLLRARIVIRRRRRRRRRARAQIKRQVHRRRDPDLTPHYRPDEELAARFHEASRR